MVAEQLKLLYNVAMLDRINPFNHHRETDPLACDVCQPSKLFKSLAGLRGHMQFKHGQLPDRAASGMLHDPRSMQTELLMAQAEQLNEVLDQQRELLEAARVSPAGSEQLGGVGITDRLKDLASKISGDVSDAVIEACRELAERHPPGLCRERNCGPCQDERNQIIMDTVNKIEERAPGTRQLIAEWEVMNQQITITDDSGRRLSMEEVQQGIEAALLDRPLRGSPPGPQ